MRSSEFDPERWANRRKSTTHRGRLTSESATPHVEVNFHDGSKASFPGRVISADGEDYTVSDGAGNMAFVPRLVVKYVAQLAREDHAETMPAHIGRVTHVGDTYAFTCSCGVQAFGFPTQLSASRGHHQHHANTVTYI